MRRSTFIILFAALQQPCRARQAGFSIHDDLVAYPQFEIIFADSYIPEQDADALFELGSSVPSESDRSLVQQTNTPRGQPTSDSNDNDFEQEVSETYELMNVPPSKYLCTIPVIEPPLPQNQTASELAKAEEARELVRAASAGWSLIRDLENTCLYFVSGWWSYQFCFGVEVVQYHALQASPKDNIPLRDPTLQEYVLGVDSDTNIDPESLPDPRSHNVDLPPDADADAGELARVPRNTELVLKGNQRYLVQRLEDGTICDLTGRPRTIEIQYHCATVGNTDRIGWIKEVTTCAYLMAVYTPRLCKDVAFLPPKPTKAHAITCREILTPDQEDTWHERKTLETESSTPDAVLENSGKEPRPVNIGGIMVGSRNILRAADHDGHQARLAPPKSFTRGSLRPNTIVIASGKTKDKGGAVEILPDAAIEDLNLDPQLVERVRQELSKRAGDNGWRLEIVAQGQGGVGHMLAIIVDVDGNEEQLRVLMGGDEQGEEQELTQKGKKGQKSGHKKKEIKAAKQKGTAKGDRQEPGSNSEQGDDAASHEGSQEEFYEEGHFRDEL